MTKRGPRKVPFLFLFINLRSLLSSSNPINHSISFFSYLRLRFFFLFLLLFVHHLVDVLTIELWFTYCLYRWNLGLCLHALNRLVLSLIKFPLSFLAFVYISTLSFFVVIGYLTNSSFLNLFSSSQRLKIEIVMCAHQTVSFKHYFFTGRTFHQTIIVENKACSLKSYIGLLKS